MTDIATKLRVEIAKAIPNSMPEDIQLDFSADLSRGDYATNAALMHAKQLGANPRELAEKIAESIRAVSLVEVASVETAGPGFVNISLSNAYLKSVPAGILEKKDTYGKGDTLAGTKVMIEYTDPNPFKEFHIGHFMPNMVGESLSRLIEFYGADVKRVNYQGDLGMHIAMAVYGMQQLQADLPRNSTPREQAEFLGKAYALGASAYKDDPDAKDAIAAINREIFSGNEGAVRELYDLGRSWSLAYFETIYTMLGTKFDHYFFESQAAPYGKEAVERNIENGVFEKSDGAVVFRGETYGLHTRVFVNSDGLPVYEAKELGLSKLKHDTWPYDVSVIVTGNEIDAYFRVLLKAMELVFPDLAAKTKHVSHGMLRLPTGKMSSRTGNVISAVDLIDQVAERVELVAKDRRINDPALIEQVAIGAIKYSVLRQALGKDIIFDFEKSISFEGDSGPYLQYAHARASSVVAKATAENILPDPARIPEGDMALPRLLYRFPAIVERATAEYAPQHVATYLIELASAFNTYYASAQILDGTPDAAGKVALAAAFKTVMQNGLWLLGIAAPEEM
jgi:arginyl-tRNA synthetase